SLFDLTLPSPLSPLSLHDALPIFAGEAHAQTRLTVLRALDKLDRLGVAGVRELLGVQRVDESGAVVPGAGLKEELIRFALAYSADRKSTRLNSSHVKISYAVFCLK